MATICVFPQEYADGRYLFLTTACLITQSLPCGNRPGSLSAVQCHGSLRFFDFLPLLSSKLHSGYLILRRITRTDGFCCSEEQPALTAAHVKWRKHLIFKAARAPLLRGHAEHKSPTHPRCRSEERNRQKVPCLINIPKAQSQPLSAPSHPHANFFIFFICTPALSAG